MNVTTSRGVAWAPDCDSTTQGPEEVDQHAVSNSTGGEDRTRYAPRFRGRIPSLRSLTVGLVFGATGITCAAQAIDEHESITEYTGPEVCIGCHEDAARAAHGGVHYQQGGAFPDVLNIPEYFYAAGERPAHPAGDTVATGLNTYCGTHDGSPRFTCAGCHVGNGRFPKSVEDFNDLVPEDQLKELANVDCLMCHQELYKRFPDWTDQGYGFSTLELLNLREEGGELIASPGDVVLRDGYAGIPNVDPVTEDFQFLPAGSDTLPSTVPIAPMTLTTLEAAQMVHATTRRSCLNCHAGAAGSDGAKRGDLFRVLANDAPPDLDYHMSPLGANLTCSDCHNAGGHRLRGRGLDLRPSDVAERFTCAHCHGDRPHKDYSAADGSKRDTHAAKVACQTCHIPRYGKAAVGTEVARDWQEPHPSSAACAGRGGWLPREDKDHDLVPSYAWFDGQSAVYYLGAALADLPTIPLAPEIAASFVGDFKTGQRAYVMATPSAIIGEDGALNRHRGVQNPEAKIYPMKEHWGKLATDGEVLIGHSTFEFFRTGSFCRAVAVGLGADPDAECPGGLPGTELPQGIEVVAVHTFQTINHGVEPKGRALACGACHAGEAGGSVQLRLQEQLGYGPRQGESLVPGAKQRGRLSGSLERICGQCHESAPAPQAFAAVHRVHVAEQGTDCAACHDFSRAARGLRLRKGT
jgi:hypothetical protein